MISTLKCVLSSRPGLGNRVSGTDFSIEEEVDHVELKAGEVRCETIFLSVDPYMRCMLDEDHPQLGEYLKPQILGQVCSGGGVGKVLESRNPKFRQDDVIVVPFLGYPWATKTVILADDPQLQVQHCPIDTPPSLFLGTLGIPGLTSYFCMLYEGKPQKDETIVISGAGGACGIVAAQLAKQKGAKVIGISGSTEKSMFLENVLGLDKAICYKDPDFQETLTDACRQFGGVDVYMDNVGGNISELVLNEINHYARIPICGQIANYDDNVSYMDMVSNEKGVSSKIQTLLKEKCATRKRFLVLDYESLFASGTMELAKLVHTGELHVVETIYSGFSPGSAFADMMSGGNLGKAIVDVCNESDICSGTNGFKYCKRQSDDKAWVIR